MGLRNTVFEPGKKHLKKQSKKAGRKLYSEAKRNYKAKKKRELARGKRSSFTGLGVENLSRRDASSFSKKSDELFTSFTSKSRKREKDDDDDFFSWG